ncbi:MULTISPECIES: hypothetical protein [unclassified Haladaptatus]|uniref:RAD55 family ATPase n=1 Tax=unclassified Haladaptatus TaxID=2622732 RepID=UPI0023E7AA6A|nr:MULTISPECIES: hypothetical protein [unclassified Haladaptatus]
MSSSDRQLQAVVSRPTTYALGSAIDIEGFEEVPPGTNLLIEGPLQADTRQLATQLLATGTAQGENAVVISSDANADRVVRDVSAFDGDADRLYVVDCTGVSGKGSFDDEPHVKYVTSPSDLTGIGVGLVKCTQEIGAGATSGLRLGVFSLSTLLRYAEVGRVFNFLHVLTGRVSAAGYFGVYTIDPSAHDDADLNVLRSLFDAALKLRETDDGTLEARVVGLPNVASTWTPLE